MLDCAAIQQEVSRYSLIKACDLDVRQGSFVRLMTPLLYPDGSNIDVFVSPSEPLLGTVTVSDLGQTVSWLSDLHIDPSRTKKRKQLANDICQNLGLTFDGWQIKTDSLPMSDVVDAVLRVGQAALRLADLCFTQRLQAVSLFKEDVEEFIADLDLPYETDPLVEGAHGREVQVDFRVRGRQPSLVLLLARGSHVSANEILSRWFDLRKGDVNRVTLYNDHEQAMLRNDDLDRLSELSVVLPWQDRNSVRELLAA